MRGSVEIEIGEDLYEVEVSHFHAARPGGFPRWDDPPDPGEIELGVNVVAYPSEGPKHNMSMSDFVLEYALRVIGTDDLDEAREKIEERCYELMIQKLEDDLDE